MKTIFRSMVLVLSMMCIIAFASPISLYAGSLDDLSRGSSTAGGSSSDSKDGSAISDYLQGYNPVTEKNMQSASTYASPIVNLIGTMSGFVIMVVSAGIFFVTALDLCYIGLPFTRSILNPSHASGGSAGGAPMGGMGMGMGMRGGMGAMGGMGGMGGGAQAGGQEYGLHRRWVSDEAVACVQLASQAQPQGGGMGMGGMGMGGMGMGGMGAMGGGMQQQAPASTKSVILEYLKKRSFFIIIFAVASVVLMGSIFMDCGLNLAELLTKIMEKLNTNIGGISV